MPELNDQFNHAETATGELGGMTAVVTGSSSGIGRAIARQFAAAGASVLVHARANRAAADEVCRFAAGRGVDARCLLADLSRPEELAGFAAEAWSWRDGVDIWVNNAGADVLTGTQSERTFEEKLEYLWRVDVMATICLSRAIGGRMRHRGGAAGRRVILNVGWDQAEFGMAGDSGEMFAAAKGAVTAFSKSLAKSLAPAVRVNCLAPGWIKTAWGDEASAYWQKRARRESLMDRWGTPEDVARAACFLASPASSFVSGLVLPVNGGWKGTS